MAVSPEVTAETLSYTQNLLATLPKTEASDLQFALDHQQVSHHSVAYNPEVRRLICQRGFIIRHEVGHKLVAKDKGFNVLDIKAAYTWGVTTIGRFRLKSFGDLLRIGTTIAAGEQQVQSSWGTGSDHAQITYYSSWAPVLTEGTISKSTYINICHSQARNSRRSENDPIFLEEVNKLRLAA